MLNASLRDFLQHASRSRKFQVLMFALQIRCFHDLRPLHLCHRLQILLYNWTRLFAGSTLSEQTNSLSSNLSEIKLQVRLNTLFTNININIYMLIINVFLFTRFIKSNMICIDLDHFSTHTFKLLFVHELSLILFGLFVLTNHWGNLS